MEETEGEGDSWFRDSRTETGYAQVGERSGAEAGDDGMETRDAQVGGGSVRVWVQDKWQV